MMNDPMLIDAPTCVLAAQECIPASELETADNLTRKAYSHVAMHEYHTAERLYWQALDIRKKVLGTNHLDIASSLQDLAELYEVQSRYTRANQFYERALIITEKVLGRQHAVVSRSLKSLLHFYRTFGGGTNSANIAALPERT